MRYPTTPPLESLQEIACSDYFDAIALTAFPTPKAMAQACSILDQSHLKVCFGAQPYLLGPKLNPNAIDEANQAWAYSARAGTRALISAPEVLMHRW